MSQTTDPDGFPPPRPLAILWEDAHLLVVDKPAGLLTQPRGRGATEPSLEEAVRAYLSPDRPRDVYLGTIHRLDRPVSGVVAWAKNVKAARRLSTQFESRTVEKLYAAIVSIDDATGVSLVTDEDQEWVDWIGPVGPSGVATFSDRETLETRRAVTWVRRIASDRPTDGWIGLWLRPSTGRTHQLRAQAARRGMPIVGDLAYGSTRPFPSGIALHARALTVHHPVLDVRMTFEAPWPKAWDNAGFAI